ncbi:MAG: hypothetical protein K0R57_5364 [Paenibacillaceae bacterium]|jgi:hypothetical protein|nr:hypothetical protein [Paenibacillaceae bacterium]
MTLGYKELRHNPQYTMPLMEDGEFLSRELDLTRPGMEEVARLVAAGDTEGARGAYLQFIADGPARRYYFDVKDVARLSGYACAHHAQSGEARLTVREADRIAEGDIPLFKGRRAVFPDGAYDWNSWLFDSSQYQLHLTRFKYISHLSRAYCLTGDEKYAACFNQIMNHFLEDNPTPLDDAFRVQHCTWEPLTVGVRMFTLSESFITFFPSPSFTSEVKMKLIKSFQQHARYVRRYHATHGNHACMQLRGLIQVALLLPELKEASGWLAYGLREFPGYIRQNVYEDGVQFEASPNYHLVVMRDLFELVPLLKRLDIPAPGYNEVLEQMYVVLMHLLTPDGRLPLFGDTDLHVKEELREVMSLGAALFGRSDFKYLGYSELPFGLLWRLGPDAAGEYGRLTAAPPADTQACFPVGGYLMTRGDWGNNAMYMAMRAGVGIAGHAHSDALSVIVHANGRELLADSGMGLFEWNKERKYAVSTRAHNTVVVDGQDQHVRSLHWNTPPTAACKIWDVRHGGPYDYWFASHYGYTRYDDPVIHSRKVLFVKNRYWLIVDLFEAKEQHRYDSYFHLPRGEAVCEWEKRQIRTSFADGNVLLVFPQQGGGEWNDGRGGTGRWAREELAAESGLLFRQGQYHPNPVVKRSMTALGNAVSETVVLPYGAAAVPHLEISRLPVLLDGRPLAPYEATGLRIAGDGWQDEICLYHRNVNVEAYLDHTGNPVSDALLPQPERIGVLELAGSGAHHEDVWVKSHPSGTTAS